MTDTAIPMPEPAQRNPGDAETDPGALTAEQQQRVRALGFARDTLVSRGLFSGTDVSKWAADDLLKIADWILQGSETPGVLFGVAVLPKGEGKAAAFDDHGPQRADDSWMDLPPTGALHENDPPTAGEGLHNPDPINRPEPEDDELLDAAPWRPEPGGDDGPSLIEPEDDEGEMDRVRNRR